MARKKSTGMTKSQKARIKEARDNGRGANAPFTGGARPVNLKTGKAAVEDNKNAWNTKANGGKDAKTGRFKSAKIPVYTHNKAGELSTDGKTHSGLSNGLTEKSSLNKQGQRTTVQQAAGNKVNREQAKAQLSQSYMNRNTAKRLVREGKISQKEADSMVNPYKSGTAGYRAQRKAMGLNGG